MWNILSINNSISANKTSNNKNMAVSDFGSFLTFFIVYLFGFTIFYFFCKIIAEYTQGPDINPPRINQPDKPPEYEPPPAYDALHTISSFSPQSDILGSANISL